MIEISELLLIIRVLYYCANQKIFETSSHKEEVEVQMVGPVKYSDTITDIIKECLRLDPVQRPTFTEILQKLKFGQSRNYPKDTGKYRKGVVLSHGEGYETTVSLAEFDVIEKEKKETHYCVLKTIKFDNKSPEEKSNIENEITSLESLRDVPNVVRLYDYFLSGVSINLAFEYIEGKDLRYYFEKEREHSPFTAVEQELIIYSILVPLDYIHAKKYIHCNICPENVLIKTFPGEKKRIQSAVLADLGHLRYLNGEPQLVKVGSIMSPEMRNNEPVSFSTDIFNLGALIYFLLFGRTVQRWVILPQE